MPVAYDGKKIIPAPFVAVQKEAVTTEDGTPLGCTFLLTVRGQLVAVKGSPNKSGVFYTGSGYPADDVPPTADERLAAILRKQEAMRVLFSEDGRAFEVQPYDGSAPMKCYPRVRRIEFAEGQWFDTCPYVITLEADCVQGLVDAGRCEEEARVLRASEEWNVEPLEEVKGTYRLTHSLAATGRRLFDDIGGLLDGKQAWEHARDYVLAAGPAEALGMGLGLVPERMYASGVLDGYSLQAFNYLRTQAVNETAGTFAATETWVCYDPAGQPPAVHDYQGDLRYSSQDGRTGVSMTGTVAGLEQRDNNTRAPIKSRWENAREKWSGYVFPALFSVAQSLVGTGVPLNPVPLSNQVGLNPVAGTVSYQYEFDNRPTPAIAGAVAETVTVTNSHAADVFARIPVLGRPFGPVLQPIDTVTEKRRSISIEAQMAANAQGYLSSPPSTDGLVLALAPVSDLGVFLDGDEESWTPNTGRYTRSTTFVWE